MAATPTWATQRMIDRALSPPAPFARPTTCSCASISASVFRGGVMRPRRVEAGLHVLRCERRGRGYREDSSPGCEVGGPSPRVADRGAGARRAGVKLGGAEADGGGGQRVTTRRGRRARRGGGGGRTRLGPAGRAGAPAVA